MYVGHFVQYSHRHSAEPSRTGFTPQQCAPATPRVTFDRSVYAYLACIHSSSWKLIHEDQLRPAETMPWRPQYRLSICLSRKGVDGRIVTRDRLLMNKSSDDIRKLGAKSQIPLR